MISVYKGNLVNIKAIEKSELNTMMEWRNNTDFRKYFREYREINTTMQEKWFYDKVINDNSTIMFSINRNSDSELLGVCGLCYINWIHRYADLSLYIGFDNLYIDNSGYAKESCFLLFDYAFRELNLNKIWTEIYEFDDKKYNLYQELGFKKDGELRQNYFYDNKWWNSYIMSLLKSDWIK